MVKLCFMNTLLSDALVISFGDPGIFMGCPTQPMSGASTCEDFVQKACYQFFIVNGNRGSKSFGFCSILHYSLHQSLRILFLCCKLIVVTEGQFEMFFSTYLAPLQHFHISRTSSKSTSFTPIFTPINQITCYSVRMRSENDSIRNIHSDNYSTHRMN